jgi:hypothetical protein
VQSVPACTPKVFTAARYDHPIMPDLGMQWAGTMLRGSVLVLLRFDVCEAIRLDRLQELIRALAVEQPSLKHPAPRYARYQRPPVMEPVENAGAGKRRTATELVWSAPNKLIDKAVLNLSPAFSSLWATARPRLLEPSVMMTATCPRRT